MRLPRSTSLLLASLAFFPSCSPLKFLEPPNVRGKVTKGDIATFKLRDLTRFGQPHLVKVSAGEIKQLDRSELKKGRMASLDAPHDYEPVNFIPPSLPDRSINFDGSILPPKDGGAPRGGPGSFPGGVAYPTGIPQNFSIE